MARLIETGKGIFELEAGPQHANPMGTLHGGIICDVTDPNERLVARAMSTCMTLRGEMGKGR